MIFIWLQHSLWLGDNGIKESLHVSKEISRQEEKNDKIKNDIDQLQAEVDAINNSSEIIEEIARSKFNMIKPCEVFYRFVS
ncbi:septum formation initiator family protein [Candidatus Ishikawella capsulata]|nr:septum formation initiator family protein [Candidatus Ishikawaella capsulata]